MDNQLTFAPEFGTRLALFIDTEEEFAWDGPFRRDGYGLASVAALRQGQALFDQAGLKPTYVTDQPIIESELGAEILREFLARGVCAVGVHLHPWLTPPFDEPLSRPNSYPGNLPESLERTKIRHLRQLMTERLGYRPIAYRAGRYGLGPNSHRILEEEGFLCDTSVRPGFDYRDDGGPDYRRHSLHPSWVGPRGTLLELPLTTIFTGSLRSTGGVLYALSDRMPSLRGLLARTGLLRRIPFTPEGVPARCMADAIDYAVDCGIRLLNFSFHSPSLAPGHTPYVRTEADLHAFFGWWDQVFDHCARRGIAPAGLDDILIAARHPHFATPALPV